MLPGQSFSHYCEDSGSLITHKSSTRISCFPRAGPKRSYKQSICSRAELATHVKIFSEKLRLSLPMGNSFCVVVTACPNTSNWNDRTKMLYGSLWLVDEGNGQPCIAWTKHLNISLQRRKKNWFGATAKIENLMLPKARSARLRSRTLVFQLLNNLSSNYRHREANSRLCSHWSSANSKVSFLSQQHFRSIKPLDSLVRTWQSSFRIDI